MKVAKTCNYLPRVSVHIPLYSACNTTYDTVTVAGLAVPKSAGRA